MTKFAKNKISVATVSRAVKNEGGKSLKHLKRALLTSTMVRKQPERCTRLLKNLKSYGNHVIILSDKKTFTVVSVINRLIEL